MGLFSSSATTTARKNIFISYRVNDTSGETGRLVDSLKQYFFEEQIFVDIDKIEPGVDFTEAIAKSLKACDVMLAIIGPNWQGINSAGNTSRINDPNDWVRLEISTALKRNIRVVPVLVDGAELPAASQLPDDLQPLIRRQAYEISNKRWKYDTEQLMRFLIKSVGIPGKNETVVPVKKEKAWLAKNLIWVIIGSIVFISIAIFSTNQTTPSYVYPQNNEPVNNTTNPTNQEEKSTVTETTSAKEYNVEGNWYDANGLYYLFITQSGSQLTITSYSMAGLQTGQGSGSVENSNVSLSVNVMNFGMITINAVLSEDQMSLTGTTKIENNGTAYTEPLRLNKR